MSLRCPFTSLVICHVTIYLRAYEYVWPTADMENPKRRSTKGRLRRASGPMRCVELLAFIASADRGLADAEVDAVDSVT